MIKMKELSVEKLKNIQFNILSVVATFCEENNIPYWLDCGTLLGAIRHKGYIPWDDDIDIGMLRDDYEKFVTLFNQQNSKYKVLSIENNSDFLYPFGKVLDLETTLFEPDEKGEKLHVNIDVFIYDNALNLKEAKKRFKKRDRLKTLYLIRTNYHSKSVLKRLLIHLGYVFLIFFPKSYFINQIVKNAKKYNKYDTKYVGNFNDALNYLLCEREIVTNLITVEFEGKNFNAPKEYDIYLKQLYGEYMTLPPIEKRKTHHKFKAYIND